MTRTEKAGLILLIMFAPLMDPIFSSDNDLATWVVLFGVVIGASLFLVAGDD